MDKASSELVTACLTHNTMHQEVTAPAARPSRIATASHSWQQYLVPPRLQLSAYPFVGNPSPATITAMVPHSSLGIR